MNHAKATGSMQTYTLLKALAISIVVGLNVLSFFLAFTDQSLDTSTMLLIPSKIDDSGIADIPELFRMQAAAPGVLLGIFSPSYQNKFERMRRRVIRQTYLQFHEQFNTTDRVCSLHEAAKMESTDLLTCRMIYTFIFQDGDTESEVSNYLKPDSEIKKSKEPDSIFLKTANQLDTTLAIQKWMEWCYDLMEDGSYDKIDYVAMVNTEVFLLPSIFWKENRIFGGFQSNTIAVLPASDNEACSEPKCIDKRFIAASHDILNSLGDENLEASDMWSQLIDRKLQQRDVSVVDIKGVAPVSDTS